MNDNARIGVFLCRCGEKIDPLVDLEALREELEQFVIQGIRKRGS